VLAVIARRALMGTGGDRAWVRVKPDADPGRARLPGVAPRAGLAVVGALAALVALRAALRRARHGVA
jgi:hypothetical protein